MKPSENGNPSQSDESYIIYDDDEQEEFGAGEIFDEQPDETDDNEESKDNEVGNNGNSSTEEEQGGLFDGQTSTESEELDLSGSGSSSDDAERGLFEELDNEFGDKEDSEEDSEDDPTADPGYDEPEIEVRGRMLVGSSDYDPTVYFRSSEDMSPVQDNSVSLIVTSPPYNADWAYGSHDDAMDYQTEYLPMLARVFTECWRVLEPAGRMVVNVPTLLRGGSSGGQAILSDIDTMINEKVKLWGANPLVFDEDDSGGLESIQTCMDETEFVHREFGVWNKGFNDAGMAPNGSFPRPGGILLNNMHEGWSVYQKPGSRDYSEMSDERIEESKIQKWADDMCDDVWDISPEDRDLRYSDDEDVPPFPEEFVKRCVALWTYRDDLVLDPFLGSGTTCKVCKEMKRHSVGFELREGLKDSIETYIGIGQQRLM